MKTLLLLISLFFSLCFYNFYTFSQGKDIFGKNIDTQVSFESFSGNLLIESGIFLLIGIFFYFYFSNNGKHKNKTAFSFQGIFSCYNILIFLYILLYVFFLYYIGFLYTGDDLFILTVMILFFIGDISFHYISKIDFFKAEKYNIRYLSLFINIIMSLLCLGYLYIYDFHIIAFMLLIYSLFFHFIIHKKYINYLSFLISILIFLFIIYYTYGEIKQYLIFG